ncbi:MAG: T9SS type A sorting domain-containing protein, partial [Bacteroidales bacterium]|nr:T9SS type A sorting domain-containing protein [Bacteroidales bacterium]
WKNEVSVIADDEDANIHLDQAEEIATIIDTSDHIYNIKKIYLDSYQQDTLPNGQQIYPEVNQVINNMINEGIFIMNYIGHGTYNGLAYEKILTIDDVENWNNTDLYPFLIAATGDFGLLDNPEIESLAEYILLKEEGGMIAIFSPTKPTYASVNSILNKNLIESFLNNPNIGLGKIVKFAKNKNNANEVMRRFFLFGDPALKLSVPKNYVITNEINGVNINNPLDTLNPGDNVTVSGWIENPSGEILNTFNGTLNIVVFDRIKVKSTLVNDPSSQSAEFTVQDSILTELQTNVQNGTFQFNFNLPYMLDEEYGTIKFSYYASDEEEEARGHFSNLIIGGEPSYIKETKPKNKFINVYPSVVTNNLNVHINNDIKNLKIDVYDLTGKIIRKSSYKNLLKGKNIKIDMSDLHDGLYILKASSDKEEINFKIIKN